MTPEEETVLKVQLEERRLALDEARFKLDNSFSRRYATSLISILAAAVAGTFALVQVKVASIDKEKEIESARQQKEKELELARIERDRRWKLDAADFLFKNRDVIFSRHKTTERSLMVNVMVVAFPPEISTLMLKNVKVVLDQQQHSSLENVEKLIAKIEVGFSTYVHPSGRFVKTGEVWTEYPPYAPGKHFTFKEARRDSDYIYLYDETRTKDGDPNRIMYLRIPVNGGWAQWSFPNPLEWRDLYIVKPS